MIFQLIKGATTLTVEEFKATITSHRIHTLNALRSLTLKDINTNAKVTEFLASGPGSVFRYP